jgi:hypothetical protein
MTTPIIPGALYRHYKGNLDRVVGLAKHSETLEDMVVYEALYDNDLGKLWVRPKAIFEDSVTVNGITIPRYSLQNQ